VLSEDSMSLWLTTIRENDWVGGGWKAGRFRLQVIVRGDCLEVATLCEDSDPAAQIRPALGNGTTFGRTPFTDGEGRMAVSVADHRRSNRLSQEAAWRLKFSEAVVSMCIKLRW